MNGHLKRTQGFRIGFLVGKDGNRIHGQVELAPVEYKVLEHAARQVAVCLSFVLQVNKECGVGSSESCLDEQIASPALAAKGEPFLVDKLDGIEINEAVDPGQKRLEEVPEQTSRPQ